MSRKKLDKDTIKMKFGKTAYVQEEITNVIFAWQHPIISCQLCIKYIFNWIMRLDHAYSPYVHRYSTFFFTLFFRAFIWNYLGMAIGVLTNHQSDAIRLWTEIPLVAGVAFFLVWTSLVVIRAVIFVLERIKLVKEDQVFMYRVGVFFVYGSVALIALGQTLE
ncbi:hypothetical protein M3182_24705 [Mesobacillus maritimus]|uniref:hypothetical protein n=1 Tax=Mesobacillus maritimus TaxID=1643336 RepID=UPI00203E48E8|nr:hypothetical protein [Mesobacillus maritimus]MCM3588828.1 hypothetical protein [Mesobacillus maritimus]MCM3670710.1 hypothetical protein [Mesobacillus maritimus]